MSPGRRSFSLPRSDGTMQNVQVLLQPTEIDTQPEYADSRRVGSVDGNISSDSTISTWASRSMPGPLQQHRQRADVVRAEHHVHPGGAAHDLAAVLLRQAAADRDLHAGMGVLDRAQVAEVAVEPVVGVLPDRAGVEHDDVGRRPVRRPERSRRPRAGRTAARSRARSSGSRTSGPRRCARPALPRPAVRLPSFPLVPGALALAHDPDSVSPGDRVPAEVSVRTTNADRRPCGKLTVRLRALWCAHDGRSGPAAGRHARGRTSTSGRCTCCRTSNLRSTAARSSS